MTPDPLPRRGFVLGGLAMAGSLRALAQGASGDWPARPIRIVVIPYAI